MKIGFLVLTVTTSIFLGACKQVDPNTIDKQDPARLSEKQPQAVIKVTTDETQTAPTRDAKGRAEDRKSLVFSRQAPVQESTERIPRSPTMASNTSSAASNNTSVTTPEPAIIAAPEPAPVLRTWQPNEAYLFRGKELLAGLQREIARQPTLSEMQTRLQSHMGLSTAQAQQLIAVLGLDPR